ncbi:MAG: hypothetical protein IPM42_09875 [Saprospiraceae bacterium]|nr:hypothetical protein [Saprospiraceae bacterium]
MRTSIFRFFIFLLFISVYNTTYATVWTVSNDPARPAQFTTITAAVNAASPGDTLRIAGSNTTYDVPTLYFKLVFIGEGANNPNGQSTQLSGFTLSRLNSSLGSSGSKFYGVKFSAGGSGVIYVTPTFSGGTLETQVLEDFIFERCQLGPVYIQGSTNTKIKNILFRNCWFWGGNPLIVSGAHINSITLTNCVIDPRNIQGDAQPLNGNLLIRNCLFLNSTSSRFVSINGAIVENCIFYKSEPTGAINSVFNNNITYLCNSNTIPYGSNAGSGNLINVNPLFISYPPLGADFAWTHNYGLQVGSPALGTGSNGTNIGLTGGNAPVNNIPGNSRIPVVTGLTLPTSSIPVNGTLEINIQAISRN